MANESGEGDTTPLETIPSRGPLSPQEASRRQQERFLRAGHTNLTETSQHQIPVSSSPESPQITLTPAEFNKRATQKAFEQAKEMGKEIRATQHPPETPAERFRRITQNTSGR